MIPFNSSIESNSLLIPWGIILYLNIFCCLGVFIINSDNGEVVVSGSLDRETQPSYTFSVVVFDKFGLALSSTAVVVITITDLNDNSPLFSSDIFRFSVTEEQPPPVPLTTITAVDVDEGVSGTVSYSLTGVHADR